jgi:acetoin utilization protein AcuC
MQPNTIMGVNQLTPFEKWEIYTRLIPPELLERLNISPILVDESGNELLTLQAANGSPSVELALRHRADFPDPALYGHLTDTLNGQIHILLYILNDPESPRFDVDQLPDGTPTVFGTRFRNLEAEQAAMEAGLAPGQVRRGLRMLSVAITGFENFVKSLGHDLYFVEPLYYHNALNFERYGFAYQQGRKLMDHIHAGFAPGGFLLPQLDGSTPFRQPEAANSIRLRSWAIHDGILGEPFTDVTMYKQVDKLAGLNTCPGCPW